MPMKTKFKFHKIHEFKQLVKGPTKVELGAESIHWKAAKEAKLKTVRPQTTTPAPIQTASKGSKLTASEYL